MAQRKNNINHGERSFLVNALASVIRSARGMLPGASGMGNTKRTSQWAEYGYPDDISFWDLYRAYRRNSVARAGIEVTHSSCWVDLPTIIDGGDDDNTSDNTPWEKTVNQTLKRFWPQILDADKRNLVGKYSAVVMIIRDGQTLDQPVTGVHPVQSIVRMIPVWQEQLKVSTTDQDPTSETYGQPTMFSFVPDRQDQNISVIQSQQIHPDRVIIFAEGSSDGSLESGQPLNEPGFNDLLDIEKIKGGSAEGFLKNASRQPVISFDAGTRMESIYKMAIDSGYEDIADMINSQVADLNSGTDSAMIMQSGSAQVLSVAAADPTPSYTVSVQSYASAIGCPFTILIGKQTGNLASTEDRTAWNTKCNSRRSGYLTQKMSSIVNWFIAHTNIGTPSRGQFSVDWSDLQAPSEADKLKNIGTMATAMQAATTALGRCPFSGNELREIGGYDPEPGEDNEPMPMANPQPTGDQ